LIETSQPLVIAVILNTSRKDDTLACLQSLAQQDYPNLRLVVLDNTSTDGSVQAIGSAYPQVQIIALRENLGYAGNNNVGISAALEQGADWVFVLNEDIVLAPNVVSCLMLEARIHPQTGILGPLVYHFDPPTVIQTAGGVMTANWDAVHTGQNQPDTGQFAQPRRVDWISGCAILVRAEVIRQNGMIDPRFFYYWEETEWCVRIARAGWEVWAVPAAHIWHKGVQINYQPGPNVTYYATRNRLLLLSTHHAPIRAWIYALFNLIRTLGAWTILPRWKNHRAHRDALWQGFWDFVCRRWGIRSQ